MSPDNFCYWLRGFTELRDNSVPPTAEQWLEIQRHLKLVVDRQDAPAPTSIRFTPSSNWGGYRTLQLLHSSAKRYA